MKSETFDAMSIAVRERRKKEIAEQRLTDLIKELHKLVMTTPDRLLREELSGVVHGMGQG